MRDWTRTMAPASYKGVPFYVEKDSLSSGRRLVIHQFPNRDKPFIEDLGADARTYKVTAYFIGDTADKLAAAFQSLLNQRGVGQLSLPIVANPVPAHCKSWSRNFEKDKLGLVAMDLEFVREGAPSSLVTVDSSAQLAFNAAGALAGLAGPLMTVAGFVGQLSQAAAFGLAVWRVAQGIASNAAGILGVAYNVLQPALGALPSPITSALSLAASTASGGTAFASSVVSSGRGVIALIDVLRQDVALPADINAAAVARIETLTTELPARVADRDAEVGVEIAELAREIGDYGEPELVYRSSRALFDAIDATDPAATLPQIVMASVMVEAALRRDYPDRPSGITARAEIATRLGILAGSPDEEVAAAAREARDRAVEYLTLLIADLAPVVRVSAGRSLPSLWWAWRLYEDPTRAVELAARNRVPHPAHMPESFEALAR